MTTLIQMYPVIIPIGDSGPMTDKDTKIFLGIFIVLNIIWAISWLITGAKYLKYVLRKDPDKYDSFYGREFSFASEVIDPCMIVLWALVIIVYAGILIGKLL